MSFLVCHLLTCLVRVIKSAIGLMEIKCYKSSRALFLPVDCHMSINSHHHTEDNNVIDAIFDIFQVKFSGHAKEVVKSTRTG